MKRISLLVLTILALCPALSAQDAETKLKESGIVLDTPASPVANYVNAVRVDNLLYLAGAGPLQADKTYIKGKIGRDLTVKEGYEAARLVGISHLAILKHELGSLNKVKQIVRVQGMVNCTEEFTDQSRVINGYSDLMVEIFGEKGKHTRAAVGMYALPLNMAVEITAIVEIDQ